MTTIKEKRTQNLRLTLLNLILREIIFLAFFPILLIFLSLSRLTVFVCAKLFQPQLHHIVEGQGALQALDNFSDKIESNSLITLIWNPLQNLQNDQPQRPQTGDWSNAMEAEIQKLRLLFQKRVLNKRGQRGELIYEELQQYWTEYLNFTFWAFDQNFDLENHIRMYDYEGDLKLPTGTCNENHLRSIVAGLMSKPWPKGQSPWEILVIKNYKKLPKTQDENSKEKGSKNKNETQTVWLLRFHHGMGDCYSFYRMLARDFFQMDAKDWPLQVNFKKVNSFEKILQKLVFPFRLAYDLAIAGMESTDGPNCWHLNKPKCGEYYASFSSDSIAVRKIKRIKNRFEVSYKSVIYCAFTRAAKRLMKDAGQEVPTDLSTMSPFPYIDSGRPEGTASYFAPAHFKLPLQLKDGNGSDFFDTNAGAHLQATFERMDKSKYFTASTAYFYFMRLLPSGPNFINRRLCGRMRSTLNLNCLQGPTVAPKFLDMELDVATVCCGTPGEIGADIIFSTMNGKQSFCGVIAKSAFPSQDLFANFEKYFEQEIDTLYEQTKVC